MFLCWMDINFVFTRAAGERRVPACALPPRARSPAAAQLYLTTTSLYWQLSLFGGGDGGGDGK